LQQASSGPGRCGYGEYTWQGKGYHTGGF